MPAVFVLAWLRLVRQGAILEKRRRSPTWQQAHAAWREQRYYSAHPHAAPGTSRDGRAEGRQQRSQRTPADAHAGGEAGHAPEEDGGDAVPQQHGARTRHSDATLTLAPVAAQALARWLDGGDSRLVAQMRRKREVV